MKLSLEMCFRSLQDELNYIWSDGKHVQFSRWAEDNEQLEDCVFLDTDGFWKTSECDAHQPGAICYYPGSMLHTNISFLKLLLVSCRV